MGITGSAIIAVLVALCLLLVTIITTWDWAVIWTALSAIATFGAAGIALWLPFHQDRARRDEAKSIKLALYADIFYEIERALQIYAEAETLSIRTAQTANEPPYHLEVRGVQERALNSSKVLEHLLRRDGIADGIIRRALDAIDLNTETANSVANLYEYETHEKGAEDLAFHSLRRDRVRNGIDEHKARAGLQVGPQQAAAGMPLTPGDPISNSADEASG